MYEQAARLRPDVKLLDMSGYVGDAVVGRGILEAETPFLPKPFKPGTPQRNIRTLLEAARAVTAESSG